MWAFGSAIPNEVVTYSDTGSQKYAADNGIVHTGGSGDNFIYIPHCSGSQYFDGNHAQVVVGNTTFAFWSNDDQGLKIYWNNAPFYTEQNPVNGSDGIPISTCSSGRTATGSRR
jgi:hypothetical protein